MFIFPKSFDGRLTLYISPNILVSIIPTHAYDLQVKVTDLDFFFKPYYSFSLYLVYRGAVGVTSYIWHSTDVRAE